MSQPRRHRWWVCRPGLEALEGRWLPAQFGVPWVDARHLSISFIPDGTAIAGHQSDLFSALDAQEPRAVWQSQILQAFQTWAAAADINFAVTADGGEPLGTPGPDQHDPRFGDIRIGAQPMSPEVLSVSVPHDPFLSGTWSGDILLNSAVALGGKRADLLPVLIHEVGHALGLDDSSDPNSVMFPHLNDTRDTLAPGDIAAIQALYGPRADDPSSDPLAGHTLPTAAPVPAPAGYDGSTPLFLYSDISAPAESDFYSFQAPGGYAGPATIRLQTAGVSLLAPRLTVLDAGGNVISDQAATGDAGGTLQVKLPRLDPNARYFVEVRGATRDVFGVGEYALAVSFDARSAVGDSAIDTLARQSYSYLSPEDLNAIFLDPAGALFHQDGHTNDTFATAEPLAPASGYGTVAPDRVTASLGDATDVDVYHINAPEAANLVPGRPLVMTVTVRATEVNGLMASVSVFDGNENPVPAVVLAHGDGTYTIQVAGARPDASYFIRVSADPSSGKVVGNYELDVEYGQNAAEPTTFVSSTPGDPGTQRTYDLVVNETQLFDFLLAAGGASGAATVATVEMTLVDAAGRTLATRSAGALNTAGGDPVYLPPGVYRVVFLEHFPVGGLAPPLAFRLFGASLTDPIGPALDDPTLRPITTPSDGTFPAVGSPGAPYAWLAVSVFSTGGSAGVEGPSTAPAFQIAPAASAAPTPNGGAPGPPAAVTASALTASALARPPQSPGLYRLAVSTLTAAATPFIIADDGPVGVVVAGGVVGQVLGQGGVEPGRTATPVPRSPQAPAPVRAPGPLMPGLGPQGAGGLPPVVASSSALTGRTEEARAGWTLATVVAVVGAFAVAYGYHNRPGVTTVGCARLPFRRDDAGR